MPLSYQWPFAPFAADPPRQSRPPGRSGHAHYRCPRRADGDDVIGSVAELLAASASCTVTLRTWKPSPSSSSSHIPGFTCKMCADLHVLEVFVQKCRFYIETTILIHLCTYVFSLDIVVTEHLGGILRRTHAETDTNTPCPCAECTGDKSVCTHTHTHTL